MISELIQASRIEPSESSRAFVLRKLEMRDFKKFEERVVEFDGGMNAVVAPNESGRSTIIDALIALFFYSPESRAKYVKELVRWGSDRLYVLRLEFEAGGEAWSLVKDFEEKTVVLRRGDGGERLDTVEEVDARLHEMLGFSSAEVFVGAGCVRQQEVAMVSAAAGKKEFGQSLERALTGGGLGRKSAGDVVRELGSALRAMRKGMKTQTDAPGALRAAMDAVEGKRAELERAREEYSRVHDARDGLDELRDEYTAAKEKLVERQGVLEKLRSGVAARKEYDQVRAAYDEMEKRRERAKELERAVVEARRAREGLGGDLNSIDQVRAEVVAAEGEKAQLAQDRAAREAEVASKREELIGKLAKVGVSKGVLGTGVGLILAGVVLGVVVLPWLAGVAVLGLGVLGFGFWKSGQEKAAVQKEIDELKVDGDVAGDEDSGVDVARLLARAGVQSLEELDELRGRVVASEQAVQTAEAELRGLGEVGSDEERRDLALRLAQLEEKAGVEVDGEKLAVLENEVAELESRVRELHDEGTRRGAVSSSISVQIDDVYGLEEELAELEKRLGELRRREAVMEKAMQTLERVRQEVLDGSSERLGDELAAVLPKITGGKYEKARVDGELNVEVYAEELGEFVDPRGVLSQGAMEQVYLVARLVLADVLSGEALPPLLLDDPFVHFDAGRREAAVKLLSERAAEMGQQVVWFTHDGEAVGGVGRVVEL